jgi:hypothetical protein
MDDELAIKTLKRVHDSAVHAKQTEAPAIADQFNEVLSSLKSEFPDNEMIQSMEEVQASSRPQEMMKGASKIEKIKLKTEQIADTLGLGDDFDRPTDEDEMPIISLEYAPSQESIQEVRQEANPEMTQEANQEVSVESIMQLVELDPQVQGHQEEVKELVRQFEEELKSDEPDGSTLRQFIADAKEYSTSVAAKLSMLGLQHGAIDILGL